MILSHQKNAMLLITMILTKASVFMLMMILSHLSVTPMIVWLKLWPRKNLGHKIMQTESQLISLWFGQCTWRLRRPWRYLSTTNWPKKLTSDREDIESSLKNSKYFQTGMEGHPIALHFISSKSTKVHGNISNIVWNRRISGLLTDNKFAILCKVA